MLGPAPVNDQAKTLAQVPRHLGHAPSCSNTVAVAASSPYLNVPWLSMLRGVLQLGFMRTTTRELSGWNSKRWSTRHGTAVTLQNI